MAKFLAEVCQGQEDAAAKAMMKRAHYNWPYMSEHKGNEAQAAFNAMVDKTLAQGEDDITDITPTPATTRAIQRMLETVQKGCSILKQQQKLTRLANYSEHGWEIVEEYTTDDMAEDSNDEHWIEKSILHSTFTTS